MFESGALVRLAETDTTPFQTVSLYLALDTTRDARTLALGELLRRKEQQMAGNGARQTWQSLAPDLEKASRYVSEIDTSGLRGLALFSCAGKELFETFTVSVSLPNLLEVGPSPYIRPLAAAASDHPRALVVLIDSRRARLFKSFLGTLHEESEAEISAEKTAGEQYGDQGRTGDSHLSRRAEQAAKHFHKEVLTAVQARLQKGVQGGFMVGGAKAAVEALCAALPAHLAPRLLGTFTCEINCPVDSVSQEAERVQRQARRRQQEDLLATLANNLGPGGVAATGLNQVLAALHENRVHTLFVRRGLKNAGGACPGCGRLRHVAGFCPLCESAMTPVDDVVNLAVAKALDSNANLEQIEGDSPLDDFGGVAALLRYA